MTIVSVKNWNPVPQRAITPRSLSPSWGNHIDNKSSQKGLRNIANPDEEENAYADGEAAQVVHSFFRQYAEEPVFLNRLKRKLVATLQNEWRRQQSLLEDNS